MADPFKLGKGVKGSASKGKKRTVFNFAKKFRRPLSSRGEANGLDGSSIRKKNVLRLPI